MGMPYHMRPALGDAGLSACPLGNPRVASTLPREELGMVGRRTWIGLFPLCAIVTACATVVNEVDPLGVMPVDSGAAGAGTGGVAGDPTMGTGGADASGGTPTTTV